MNLLSQETSPYLKQHEENPVQWHPWGPEALEKARREDKPILLSIGYSSCHWCHVMAHESFENEEVARALNESFVSIKVDREERPDLDQVYQNVAQAMTGGGGWPLTVFLLPDLRPFFGGTYFPPEDRYGRPGFLRVVQALAQAYQADRAGIEENASKLTAIIHQLESGSKKEGIQVTVPLELLRPRLEEAADRLLQAIDWQEGGIGSAPKFPNTGVFTFLWRVGKASQGTRAEMSRRAVILTLKKMAEGGIFDQLGGGFSRYSVDDHWAVPHFEKMLYDNALLLQLYAEVLEADRIAPEKILSPELRRLFSETIRKTAEYVLREMKVPGGAFYAAQDADSEGVEGKYFVWNPEQLQEHLDEDSAQAFALRYGVDRSGNFEHGTTVLHQARSVTEVASLLGKSDLETQRLIESAALKLREIRDHRIKPGLDDKTLVSWSGLMISGLVFAAGALRAEGQVDLAIAGEKAASEALDHLMAKAWVPGQGLLATIQKGEGRFQAYLDDHAFLSRAALDLIRVNPDRATELTQFSRVLLEKVLDGFRDPSEAGYFFVANDHEALLARPKSVYDQAIPSGTAVVLSLLQWHSEIAEDPATLRRLRAEFESQSQTLFAQAVSQPYGHGELLCSALQALRGSIWVEAEASQLETLGTQPEVLPKQIRPSGPMLWCSNSSCQEVKLGIQEQYWQSLQAGF